jgi:hypothetical protein
MTGGSSGGDRARAARWNQQEYEALKARLRLGLTLSRGLTLRLGLGLRLSRGLSLRLGPSLTLRLGLSLGLGLSLSLSPNPQP